MSFMLCKVFNLYKNSLLYLLSLIICCNPIKTLSKSNGENVVLKHKVISPQLIGYNSELINNETGSNEYQKILNLIGKSNSCLPDKVDSAILLGKEAYSLASALKNDSLELLAAKTCLNAYLNKPYCEDSGLQYVPRMELLINRNHFTDLSLSTLQNISSLYTYLHRYDEGIKYAQLALDIAKQTNTNSKICQAKLTLGELYRKAKLFDNAKEVFMEAGEIAMKEKDNRLISSANRGVAICYDMTRDYPNAEKYFDLSLTYALKDSSEKFHYSPYGNLAVAQMHLGKYNEAISNFNKGMSIAKKYFPERLLTEYKNLCETYKLKGDYDSSIYYGTLSLNMAREKNEVFMQNIVTLLLAEAYHLKGDNKQAYEYQALAYQLSDSLKQKERDNALASSVASYKHKEQKAQIDLLSAEKNMQQLRIQQQQSDIKVTLLIAQQSENEIELLKRNKDVQDLKLNQTQQALQAQTLEANAQKSKLELEKKDKALREEQLAQEKLFRNLIISGLLIFLVVVFLMFNQYKLKKKLQQQEVLANQRRHISADLHDDLGSTLSSMSIYSEAIKNKLKHNENEKAMELVQRIGDNARETISSLNDIVWSLNPVNDNGEKLFSRMESFASALLVSKEIQLSFKTDPALHALEYSMEAKQNLFLIFKEIINNCAKYSQAKNVSVLFSKSGLKMIMEIIDDGVGFDVTYNSQGNGIRNITQRTEELNGDIQLNSSNTGTLYQIQFPVMEIQLS